MPFTKYPARLCPRFEDQPTRCHSPATCAKMCRCQVLELIARRELPMREGYEERVRRGAMPRMHRAPTAAER